MRPIDRETIITEKVVLLFPDPKRWGLAKQGGPAERPRFSQEMEGEGIKCVGKSLYCGFCGKECVRRGKQLSDCLPSIIIAGSELWRLSLVVCYQALGWLRKRDSVLEWKRLHRKWLGV